MASSEPLAAASARPLSTRLIRKKLNSRVVFPRGARQRIAISTSMEKAANSSSRRRPTMSARAPEGTSAMTMVVAHTALRIENWATVSPKSKNKTVKIG